MALPNKIDNTVPAGADNLSAGDDEIRAFKVAVQDILGIPNNTNITVAGFTFVAQGLKLVTFSSDDAAPAKNTLVQGLVPKVWAKLSVAAGVPAIDADFGIDTVTDNGVGDFTLNVTTANVFSTANWCPVATAQGITSSSATGQTAAAVNALTTSTVRLVVKDMDGTLTDPTLFTMVGMGIQT